MCSNSQLEKENIIYLTIYFRSIKKIYEKDSLRLFFQGMTF